MHLNRKHKSDPRPLIRGALSEQDLSSEELKRNMLTLLQYGGERRVGRAQYFEILIRIVLAVALAGSVAESICP